MSHTPKRLAFLPLLGYAAIHLPGVTRNRSISTPVMRYFATQRKEIWLTIDDGPTPGDTEAICNVLAKHNTHATFFLIGSRVDANPTLARRIANAGHQVGNHTYHHYIGTFWLLPKQILLNELHRTSHTLFVNTGQTTPFFRPPAGQQNIYLGSACKQTALTQIGWSLHAHDAVGCFKPMEAMDRIVDRVFPGAILVTHQGRFPCHAEALDYLLTRLREKGYACVIPDRHVLSVRPPK